MIMTMKVVKKVQRDFPPGSQASVLEYLSLYGVRAEEPEEEMVRIAILDLAAGDGHRIAELIRIAKQDYRQILRQAFLQD